MKVELTKEDAELIKKALKALGTNVFFDSSARTLAVDQRVNQILEKLEYNEAE